MSTTPETPIVRTERLLAALVALIAADRDERASENDGVRRAEPILAAAGLSITEIAELTDRKYEAVKATLRRSKERR